MIKQLQKRVFIQHRHGAGFIQAPKSGAGFIQAPKSGAGFIQAPKSGAGFTLIELLVVIAIIGILASLIIVSLSGARGKAQDTQRKNNARNLDTALAQFYLDQTPNTYPAHATAGGTVITGTSGSEVPLGLTGYLTGTQAYTSTLTHKYISGASAVSYAQAWLLASKTETSVSTGNGVYAVTGADDAASTVTAGNLLALVGGYVDNTNKAFVTYGPQ